MALTGDKKNRIIGFRNLALGVFVLMAMIMAPSQKAFASSYDSWVRDKSSGPEVSTSIEGDRQAEVKEDLNNMPDPSQDTVGSTEKRISETLMSFNMSLSKALREGKTDVSATGVILSHIKSSDGTSFFVFDLTDTNIYGIIGATFYAALRTLALGFLFIIVLCRLIVTLYEGDVKGLANMKEAMYSALIVMILLFIMPQIVDWMCTARNSVAIFLYERLGDVGLDEVQTYEVEKKYKIGTGVPFVNITLPFTKKTTYAFSGMELTYFQNWELKKNIVNALVYFMACIIVPIVYMFSYIKIAIMEMILFGLYPAFAILGYRDKNITIKWSAIFFSNVFVPVIDLCVLYIPAKMIEQFDREGTFGVIIKALVIAAVYLSAVAIRNKILELIGNAWGVKPSIAGAIALGAAAASGVGSLFGGLKETAGGVTGLVSSGGGDSGAMQAESDIGMAEMAKPLDAIGSSTESGAGTSTEAGGGLGEQKELNEVPDRDTASDKNANGGLNEAESILSDGGMGNAETEENRSFAMGEADDALRTMSENARGLEEEPAGTSADSGSGVVGTVDTTGNNTTDQEQLSGVGTSSEGGTPYDLGTPSVDVPPEDNVFIPMEDGTVAGGSIDEANALFETQQLDNFDKAAESGNGEVSESADELSQDINKDVMQEVGTEAVANSMVSASDVKALADGVAETSKSGGAAGKSEGAVNSMLDKAAEARAKAVVSASRGMDARLRGSKNPNKYENFNTARLANLESMGNLRQQEATVTNNITTANKAAMSTQIAITANEGKMKALEAKTVKTAAETREHDRLSRETRTLYEKMAGHQRSAMQYTDQRDVIQQSIAQLSSREAEFAAVSAGAGMGDKVYVDATAFAKDMERVDRARRAASYKGFEADAVKGFLTPEDRVQFERQESIRRIGKGVGAMGGALAGVAATGALAYVSTVGGEEAPQEVVRTFGKGIMNNSRNIGAGIGGLVGGEASDGLISTAGGAKKVGGAVKTVAKAMVGTEQSVLANQYTPN